MTYEALDFWAGLTVGSKRTLRASGFPEGRLSGLTMKNINPDHLEREAPRVETAIRSALIWNFVTLAFAQVILAAIFLLRSEERRVGKECRRLCRSRWSPYH
jgi:hypothetical protein